MIISQGVSTLKLNLQHLPLFVKIILTVRLFYNVSFQPRDQSGSHFLPPSPKSNFARYLFTIVFIVLESAKIFCNFSKSIRILRTLWIRQNISNLWNFLEYFGIFQNFSKPFSLFLSEVWTELFFSPYYYPQTIWIKFSHQKKTLHRCSD